MLSQYAYGKLQSTSGEEYFIHSLPAIVTSKKCKQMQMKSYAEVQYLPISSTFNNSFYHAIIYYQEPNYQILPLTQISVDGEEGISNPQLAEKLHKKDKLDLIGLLSSVFKQPALYHSAQLKPVSRLMISTDPPEIFYFCLPVQNIQRNLTQKIVTPVNQATLSPSSNSTKWTPDDYQQLKKLLLLYGYERWKQIQRSSSTMGGKLDTKPLSEVKAYANSYLRALGLALPEEETNLKLFLQKLIEQNNQEFQQYQPNLKDWEPHIQLPQRAIQYTKRLQLLHRVKMLIRKYREDSLRNMTVKDRRKISWDGLLNFIPLGLLFGQRPAAWWAKKHDIDLLLGIYKYGYANYVTIRAAKEYCFVEMQKSQNLQDFPVADNLTRRLKKLINTIVKIQQNQGQIDFDDQAESEQDEKLWSDSEKRALLIILTEYGVPVTNDNKSNYSQLKDKVKTLIKDFTKSPNQVEKMVSRIRWNCQQIISDEKLKQQNENNQSSSGPFKINYEQANKFIKNINILEFIRKSILSIDGQNLKMFLKEVDERSDILKKDHPAYMENKIDQQLLTHVNKNGLVSFSQMKVPENKIFARMEWLCEVFKTVKEKLQNIKKKNKTFDESTKKKKFQITKDKDGNIKFPIVINPSLTLIATGKICTMPNYHSEHNLFPIGYSSIRMHASMFNKGQRAKYRCEILEGENRPIYKVTPQQDPENPIIKDSSTGCWVHICQKVNNLQENKKEKVTISGTERFGLLEQNVVRILEDLPEAQKCSKYKFKKNIPKEAE